MAKSSIPKTAFQTQFGKYQFNVMPFELVGAPDCFQWLMNELLADHAEYSAAYIDDVVIFSLTWEDHLLHLEKVFNCLREVGLTAKLAKCHLGMHEVEYLGHTVGGGKVRPQKAKIEAVEQFARPRSKKDMQPFLGLAGYYQRFIQCFAELALPLTKTTTKEQPEKVVWMKELHTSFHSLKTALICGSGKALTLINPSFCSQMHLTW